MKKITLLTPFDTGNIGTVLQAYATQTLIKENGCETDLIYYHYDSIQNPFLISNLFKRGLKNYIGSIAGFLMRSPARKSLWRFIKTHLNLTEKMTHEQLEELAGRYDKVIVGSDCVWNGEAFTLETAYLLDFIEDDSKKGNFASSFACDAIPDEQKEIFMRCLSRFPILSVREDKGKELIRELTGKEATVVLDPTLVKDSFFWTEVAAESKLQITGEYIFVAEYAISAPLLRDAEKLAERYHLPLYFLYPPKGKKAKGKVLLTSSPQDVLYLIQNAKFVFTDSYHMMIFSINFSKEFFAYQTKTNLPAISKYHSILKILHLERRLFPTESMMQNPVDIQKCPAIDYGAVSEILEKERKVSKDYLDGVLK